MARPPETWGHWYGGEQNPWDVSAVLGRLMETAPAYSGVHTDPDEVLPGPVLMSRPDRIAVTQGATQMGYSQRQIAAVLGCDVRSVARYRASAQ